MNFYRGATYKLPIRVLIKKQPLSFDDVEKIEFSFGGDIVKTYPDDDSITRSEDKLIIYLSSADTMLLDSYKTSRLQAKISFKDNSIKFSKLKSYTASDTLFKEELAEDGM